MVSSIPAIRAFPLATIEGIRLRSLGFADDGRRAQENEECGDDQGHPSAKWDWCMTR